MQDDYNHCGAPADPVSTPVPAPAAAPYTPPYTDAPLDKSAFFKQFMSKSTRGWIIYLLVVCFFTAALSLVLMLMDGYLSRLMDIVFYLVMGILLLKNKSWVITLIITIYGGFFTIIGLASGSTNGILAVVGGIIATIALKKLQTAYNNYAATGAIPEKPL